MPKRGVMHATEQPVPADDEPTQDVDGPVAYKVIGRQRVDEVKRGGTLYLDPNEPRTARLIERGQIARVDPTQED